jgi:hypothetical protein
MSVPALKVWAVGKNTARSWSSLSADRRRQAEHAATDDKAPVRSLKEVFTNRIKIDPKGFKEFKDDSKISSVEDGDYDYG